MKTETIVDKDGNKLTTKEGTTLYNHTLEVGDELIPQINKVLEETHEATVKGKKQNITSYKIPVKVRGNEDVLFITLTPTQAKVLKTKINNGVILTQHVFSCYGYTNDYGDQVGIGLKVEHTPPIEFD